MYDNWESDPRTPTDQQNKWAVALSESLWTLQFHQGTESRVWLFLSPSHCLKSVGSQGVDSPAFTDCRSILRIGKQYVFPKKLSLLYLHFLYSPSFACNQRPGEQRWFIPEVANASGLHYPHPPIQHSQCYHIWSCHVLVSSVFYLFHFNSFIFCSAVQKLSSLSSVRGLKI